MASHDPQDDSTPVEANDLADELRGLRRRSAFIAAWSAISATVLFLPLYMTTHSNEQPVDLQKVWAWVAGLHRTVGAEVDVLAAAPAIAAVVLGVWIATALTSPIDDRRFTARERARHILLDNVTFVTTFVSAVVLWMMVPLAGFGARGWAGAVVSALLAIFCSAVAPVGHDRADAHRIALVDLERCKSLLDDRYSAAELLTDPQSLRWHMSVRALPWWMPVVPAISVVGSLIVAVSLSDASRLTLWRTLIGVALAGVLEFVWSCKALLTLIAWSVHRTGIRGYSFSNLAFGTVVSLALFLSFVTAILLTTALLWPLLLLVVAYVLPLLIWLPVRDNKTLDPVKAVYVGRQARVLALSISAEKRTLQQAAGPAAQGFEEDVTRLLQEVQLLRQQTSASAKRRWRLRRWR